MLDVRYFCTKMLTKEEKKGEIRIFWVQNKEQGVQRI